MNEEFVSYEIANNLKEKGFKEKCVAHYYPSCPELFFNKTPFRGAIVEDCLYSYNSLPIDCIGSDLIDAPTISQVLKWLRYKQAIHIDATMCTLGWYFNVFAYEFYEEKKEYGIKMEYQYGYYQSYEEAALACIEYVLDNLI